MPGPSRLRILSGALACALLLGSTSALADAPDPDRYVVTYDRPAAARAALAAAGARIELELPAHDAFAAHIPAPALSGLSRNPNIVSIEPDQVRRPLAETQPYGISMVQADGVSDAAASNRTVCIIDSGYDLGHPDLSAGGNVTGSSDPGGSGDWFSDGSGHGTHVAGTISALAGNGVGVVGVLPSGTVGLHIVRVFGDDGTWAYTSTLVAALDECRTAGANVVNMSLGGSRKSRFEDVAMADAYANGLLLVAAAGNDGNTRHSYPASYDSVISVAALDSTGTVADFSQQTNQVELAGPGVSVLSTVPRGHGVDTTLTVAGSGVEANAMEGTPLGSATGALVDCGIGDATCTGAGGAVCLIQRGSIAFSDKVLACEDGGGVAAVLYNNEPGALLGTLGDVVTSIPSVGISDVDGAALAGQLGSTATLTLAASDYALYDGTSMASPHVAGVAALVWSQSPGSSNEEIRAALDATAVDLGAPGRDNAYGYGLVQAQAAVDYLAGGPVCTPTETNESSCSDGLDNDCDGFVDGADADCAPTCEITEVTEVSCSDGIDNDCDGFVDGNDTDCQGTCNLGQPGDACSSDGDCCSAKCKGKPGSQTCR